MNRFNPNRRHILQGLGVSAALGGIGLLPDAALAAPKTNKLGRVVVVGGGFGGATAAKYLRKWSNGAIEVTLIEREKQFISCPASNEVLGGHRAFDSLVHSYEGLKKNWGVKLVQGNVTAVD